MFAKQMFLKRKKTCFKELEKI